MTDKSLVVGTDTITVSATDNEGGVASPDATIAVTVAGDPVLSVPSTATLSVATATPIAGVTLSEADATATETFTVTLADGNGSLSATAAGAAIVGNSGAHTLTISGVLGDVNDTLASLMDTDSITSSDTITVTASDQFGNTATQQSIGVTVSTGAPQLAGQITPPAATEDVALPATTELASFTDTALSDTPAAFSATIDWGDGSTSSGTIIGGDGSFTVEGGHTYADEGAFPLGVTITDTGDSAELQLGGTVSVADSDVLTPTGLTITANPNVAFAGPVATFSDVNAGNVASDFTATVDWGDGTSTPGTVTSVGGLFTVSGDHTYASTGQDTVAVTLTDDAPGTATATAIGTVDVVPQLAGEITLPAAAEDAALPANTELASFTDTTLSDTPATFGATIDWGDGSTSPGTIIGGNGSFTVEGGHTYADEGGFPLGITITDTADSTELQLGDTVTVADSDVLTPTGLTLTANPNLAFTGSVATFADVNTGNVASDFTATIAWGDGTSTPGTITESDGLFTVSGDHTYASIGQDTVTVTMTDDAPGTATATAIGTVDVVPQLTGQITPPAATEDLALLATTELASFTDTTLNDTPAAFNAMIDWGDGLTSTGTITGEDGSFTVSGGHTYADEGSFPLGVTVTDTADGADLELGGTVTVADGDVLTPTGLTLTANPNLAFTGPVATFSDADTGNMASDFTATIAWGDGTTTSGTITGSDGLFTVSGDHTYALTGQDTVTVTMTDDAPGTATATAIGTLDVVPQLAGQITLSAATADTPLPDTTEVASFTDRNLTDTVGTFNATINWGDGAPPTVGTITGSNGSFAVDGGHTYAQEGDFLVGVTIDDTQDSAQLPLSGLVVAADGNVLAGQGVTFAASPGVAFTGTVASFTDADTISPVSDFTATIDWGDGSIATLGTITGSDGSFSVSGDHTYASTGQDTVTVTMSDLAPGIATATAIGTADVGQQLAGQLTLTAATADLPLPSTTEVASFTDTNQTDTAGTFAATIDWGDGTPLTVGTITGSSGSFAVDGGHTYTQQGGFQVGVTINDTEDGAQLPLSGQLVAADGNVFSGQGATFVTTSGLAFTGAVAAFSDADLVAVASELTAVINWGDGSSSSGTVTGGGGTFTVLGAHTYAAPGQDTVTVTLSDVPGTATATAVGTADIGQIFTLTKSADNVSGGVGDNIVDAVTNTLSAGDAINGGGSGANTLTLMGAGLFNLKLPTTLANVQTIDAQEGQAAWSSGGQTFAATNQVITLRDGMNITVDVSPAAINPANPKPATITVNGANDASVINLASGNDTVTVGSAAETVHGGSGNDQIQVTVSTIGATIDGGSGNSTLAVIGGGSIVMGTNVTNISNVLLAATPNAMSFIANGMPGLVVTDNSQGADMVMAGGLNQTLTGGGGHELFVGFSGGATTFKDMAAVINGDTISGFLAAGDKIDFTNVSFTSLTKGFTENGGGTAGVLMVSDGIHSAAVTLNGSFTPTNFHAAPDGGVGTVITYS